MNNSPYRPSAPSTNHNPMFPQQQPQGFYPGPGYVPPQQPHYPPQQHQQQPNIGGAVAAGVIGGMVAGAMVSSHQPHFPPPHHHQPHFDPHHNHHKVKEKTIPRPIFTNQIYVCNQQCLGKVFS